MRDLQADLDICDKATPGPWEECQFQDDPNEWGVHCPQADGVVIKRGIASNALTACRGMTGPNKVNNAVFIAASREGWPETIERAIAAETQIERMQKVVDAAREVFEDFMGAELYSMIPLKKALAELEAAE